MHADRYPRFFSLNIHNMCGSMPANIHIKRAEIALGNLDSLSRTG
jgi:hypothetical protein